MNEEQVDQETEDKCRNESLKDGRRHVATNVPQLTQGGKAARCCPLHVGFHRQILIDKNAEITDSCRR